MKRGLVIGKFMPIHLGHIALIRFAALRCDELIVSMSYTDHDVIDHEVRLGWIEELFKEDSKIKVKKVRDDFDDENLPLSDRTKLWAAKMSVIYPQINIIFSSESYGEWFARAMGAVSILFDEPRSSFPVSASNIRKNPFAFWDFIPPEVKPYFVKKICFYGPESTGKSTLAGHMARDYNTVSVPEVSREFISSNDFTVEEIIQIGHAQTERILNATKVANKIVFCDTDLITTQIYCRHYLKVIPPILYELEREVSFDLYFLMDIDVPWVADGLRDLGNRREEMFDVFKHELEVRNIPYKLVKGNWEERSAFVKKEIDFLWN